MKPEFWPFERNDTEAVTTLLKAVLPDEQPHNEPSAVLELKTRTDNLCFVATMDRTIRGFVMGGFDGHRGSFYESPGFILGFIKEPRTSMGKLLV